MSFFFFFSNSFANGLFYYEYIHWEQDRGTDGPSGVVFSVIAVNKAPFPSLIFLRQHLSCRLQLNAINIDGNHQAPPLRTLCYLSHSPPSQKHQAAPRHIALYPLWSCHRYPYNTYYNIFCLQLFFEDCNKYDVKMAFIFSLWRGCDLCKSYHSSVYSWILIIQNDVCVCVWRKLFQGFPISMNDKKRTRNDFLMVFVWLQHTMLHKQTRLVVIEGEMTLSA